jgi:hypothetical protein
MGAGRLVCAVSVIAALLPAAAAAATVNLSNAHDKTPPGQAEATIAATGDAISPDFDVFQVEVHGGSGPCAPQPTNTGVPVGGVVPISASLPFSAVLVFTPKAAGPNTLCGYVTRFSDDVVLASSSVVFASLGPTPGDLYNCSSFPLLDGTTAQQYLQIWPGDPSRLDGDSDGLACEELTATPITPASPQPVPPPNPPTVPTQVVDSPPPISPSPGVRCLNLRQTLRGLTRQLLVAKKATTRKKTVAARRAVLKIAVRRKAVATATRRACRA